MLVKPVDGFDYTKWAKAASMAERAEWANSVEYYVSQQAESSAILFPRNLRAAVRVFGTAGLRYGEVAMRRIMVVCMLLSLCAPLLKAEDQAVFESTKARQDADLSADPSAAFWRHTRPVYEEVSNLGEPLKSYRTEVRSHWTDKYLYLLFICPYDELALKPSPDTTTETNQLWNWDVAEAFIGSDFQNIKHYKEFQVSPQAEWVDLDINLGDSKQAGGWRWNSGMTVAAHIDTSKKIWYGAMRIPFSALQDQSVAAGQTLRINLLRCAGKDPNRVLLTWQPSMSKTFHVPEKFGLLRLVGKGK